MTLPTVVPGILLAASVVLGGVAFALRLDPTIRTLVDDRVRDWRPAPSSRMAVLRRLGRSRLGQRIPTSDLLRRRLQLAGTPISVEALRGLKIAIVVGAVFASLLLSRLTGSAILLAIVGVPAGLRLPDLVIARQAARRQQQIRARVPDLVEILVATSEAGLSPPLAFRRASELVGGPLADELRVAVRQLDLGLPWGKSLDQVLRQTDVPALRRLVAALNRSLRLGTPVSSSLRSVAEDLRIERRTHAEEMARRAPVKMLFPMVFLILPAFLLLTVGPVFLATIRSFH
jgi:tight adherence protein C